MFSKALGIYFSWEVEERNAPVVGAITPVSLFVYGDITFLLLGITLVWVFCVRPQSSKFRCSN